MNPTGSPLGENVPKFDPLTGTPGAGDSSKTGSTPAESTKQRTNATAGGALPKSSLTSDYKFSAKPFVIGYTQFIESYPTADKFISALEDKSHPAHDEAMKCAQKMDLCRFPWENNKGKVGEFEKFIIKNYYRQENENGPNSTVYFGTFKEALQHPSALYYDISAAISKGNKVDLKGLPDGCEADCSGLVNELKNLNVLREPLFETYPDADDFIKKLEHGDTEAKEYADKLCLSSDKWKENNGLVGEFEKNIIKFCYDLKFSYEQKIGRVWTNDSDFRKAYFIEDGVDFETYGVRFAKSDDDKEGREDYYRIKSATAFFKEVKKISQQIASQKPKININNHIGGLYFDPAEELRKILITTLRARAANSQKPETKPQEPVKQQTSAAALPPKRAVEELNDMAELTKEMHTLKAYEGLSTLIQKKGVNIAGLKDFFDKNELPLSSYFSRLRGKLSSTEAEIQAARATLSALSALCTDVQVRDLFFSEYRRDLVADLDHENPDWQGFSYGVLMEFAKTPASLKPYEKLIEHSAKLGNIFAQELIHELRMRFPKSEESAQQRTNAAATPEQRPSPASAQKPPATAASQSNKTAKPDFNKPSALDYPFAAPAKAALRPESSPTKELDEAQKRLEEKKSDQKPSAAAASQSSPTANRDNSLSGSFGELSMDSFQEELPLDNYEVAAFSSGSSSGSSSAFSSASSYSEPSSASSHGELPPDNYEVAASSSGSSYDELLEFPANDHEFATPADADLQPESSPTIELDEAQKPLEKEETE